ncbi:MAG: hypothetical protein ACFFC6_00595 [Promethearchaeota archaeon]
MGLTVLVTIHQLLLAKDESEIPEGPYAHFSLKIIDEKVYTNSTIQFTTYRYFDSYGGYPIPEVNLFFLKL